MLFEGWCGCSYPDLLKPQSDHVFVISFQTFKPQFISWVSTTDLSLFHMLLLLKVWIFSEMLNRVKCNLTELTTRSKLHSWHSVAQRCFALAWRQRQGLLVVPAAFVAWGWICPWGAFLGRLRAVLAVSGSLAYQACARACLHGFAWLSIWCGGVHVLSSISPPSSPYSGEEGLLLNRFSIELTVQCDRCLFWGLGWWARGWVAGWAGLWGVPLTWVQVVGFSPLVLEHPTSICDTGVN